MEQKGNMVTLPLQGKVVGRLQGMMPLSWQGMVVWVWFWQGFMQVGGRESEREEDFKSLLLPCLCIGRGEEYTQCRLKRHRVPNFFFFKWNVIRKNPKMGYDRDLLQWHLLEVLGIM
jgi:hypothetical protein